MVKQNDLSMQEWIELLEENLEKETEEQTLFVITTEIQTQAKYG
jgi:hypothetical protein